MKKAPIRLTPLHFKPIALKLASLVWAPAQTPTPTSITIYDCPIRNRSHKADLDREIVQQLNLLSHIEIAYLRIERGGKPRWLDLQTAAGRASCTPHALIQGRPAVSTGFPAPSPTAHDLRAQNG